MKCIFKFKEQRHAVILFFVLFVTWTSFTIFRFFYQAHDDRASNISNHQSYYTNHNPEWSKIGEILKRTSMGDNRVIVTILDREFANSGSLFDIFLEGFVVGHDIQQLLNHIVVFTYDGPSCKYCESLHPNCFNLDIYRTNSNWATFRNHNHPRLGWRIVDILGEIIDIGYSVLYTEIDVLWMRNPFAHIRVSRDITTAFENVHTNWSDLGFFYMSCNERMFQFLKYWKMSSVVYPNNTHKSVFDIIKRDSQTEAIGLRIDYLDPHIFGGNFCESTRYSNITCTLHAKCFGSSIDAKVHNLRKIVEIMKSSSVPHQAKTLIL